jgi:ubiquinone/menaquinone biosynthesis C-methylase UbiE
MEEKGYTNIEIVLGEPEDCKLPKNSLDYVLIHAMLFGIKESANLFASIAPSLKPGGKLIVMEQEDGRAVSTSGDQIERGYYRTKQEYLDCFSETVFQVDKVDETLLPHDLIFIFRLRIRTRNILQNRIKV